MDLKQEKLMELLDLKTSVTSALPQPLQIKQHDCLFINKSMVFIRHIAESNNRYELAFSKYFSIFGNY